MYACMITCARAIVSAKVGCLLLTLYVILLMNKENDKKKIINWPTAFSLSSHCFGKSKNQKCSEHALPNFTSCRIRIRNVYWWHVTCQNSNHSLGPWPGRLVPSSHQRRELSNTIFGTFSRGDKRVWKCIPIPNCLGEKATLINISVSSGNLIRYRMIIPAMPSQGDKVICWYTGFTLQTFV